LLETRNWKLETEFPAAQAAGSRNAADDDV
jgi:hypothetical protein